MGNIKFERISLEEGLSQSVVYSIVQDAQGFMWFGTQDGLNRFDGYNFKLYKNDPQNDSTISSNYAKTIFEDKDKTLWVGSLNGGLSKYDKNLDCFENFFVKLDGVKSLSCIAEDKKGFLWIGCEDGGLNQFDKESKEFIYINWKDKFNFIKNIYITCLLIDDKNHLWIGTWDSGIYIYDSERNTIVNFKNNPQDKNSLSNNIVHSIYEDSRKNILIGTRNGFNIFNESDQNFQHYFNRPEDSFSISGNVVSSIYEDKNKFLWIGTKDKGLNKFDFEKKQFESFRFNIDDPHSLSNDTVFSLYNDNYNVLWIGTFGGGLCKIDCDKKKIFTLNKFFAGAKSESINDVLSIFIDSKNVMWIGTLNKGLYKKLPDTDNVINYSRDNSNIKGTSILCIHEDRSDILWIGTLSGGLNRYDKISNDFKFYKYKNDTEYIIYSICDDISNDFLWIATYNYGLLKFDKRDGKFHTLQDNIENSDLLYKDVITGLCLNQKNILWIGTKDNGLLKYDLVKNKLKQYKSEISNTNSLNDNSIITIHEDKKNNLWIGTFKGGLNKLDINSGNINRYSEENGLPDNMIKAILEDGNENLWMSTNNGLSCFNPVEETFRNFDFSDGLQSKEFNDRSFFKAIDGTLYFGGINGFNYFKPEDIKDNPFMPEIVITDFQIFNKSVVNSPENPFLKKNITVTDEIILSYRESVFSFEFAALIYNNPEKNQYAYKMEGFDKDWIYCGSRRQVTYTNLDPGDYVFRVKGSNNDGVWNEEGTSVKMTITPPYWKTWWFKGLGFMGIVAAAGMTYRQRIEKIKKEKRSQEEFSRKLMTSQEDDRKRVAAELHDSLGQDLMIIKNKALISLKKADNMDKFREQMNEISELTSSTINEVREISYNLRPYELDRMGLTKTILALLERAKNSTEINFIADVNNVDKLFKPEAEINIYRIIQECLTNIIKHSEATEVMLNLRKSEKEIKLFISDNGKGFDTNKQFSDTGKKGFGLKGIPERVKLFGGAFKIQSAPAKGTSIRITIPFK